MSSKHWERKCCKALARAWPQMWQQFDCDASHVTKQNAGGCLADLFPWTEVTVGSNNNGKPGFLQVEPI
jgi:hypothetical protein